MTAEDEDFGEPGGLDDRDGLKQTGDADDERDLGDEPDLDDDERDDDGRGWAWPAGGYPPAPASGPRRRPVVLIVTAVVAAAAGFGGVAVAMHDVPGSTAAASGTPSGGAPSPSGGQTMLPPEYGSGSGGTIPTPGLGQRLELQLGGRVTAVSAASITVGAGGHSVTAAVTTATRITGRVTRIAGIRVGDTVSATISGSNGKLTADSIQDPASLP